MLEVLTATLLGVAAGVITGLIPGIHVNLLAALILAGGIGAGGAPFLVAISITHSFLSTIPAILLGAPESATALGVLPGHRYVLQGNGYMAIKLTLVGSYLGLLISLALIPLWWMIIGLYDHLVSVMGYLLLGVSAYMILRDNKSAWALLVYLLSGALGWILLNQAVVEEPLFPLFSGLFGTSTLLYSLTQTSNVPTQKILRDIQLRWSDATKALLAGNLSGFLTSMLPGLGAAQAAILGMNLTGKIGDHGFLVMIGTISTVNFSLSLLTWLALEKARNGAVVAITQILTPSTQAVATLTLVALIAASITVPLCLWLARQSIKLVTNIPYTTLSLAVVALITLLVAAITGVRGLYVLLVATAIGLIPAIVRCGRAHAMGCLMLPVAFYFF